MKWYKIADGSDTLRVVNSRWDARGHVVQSSYNVANVAVVAVTDQAVLIDDETHSVRLIIYHKDGSKQDVTNYHYWQYTVPYLERISRDEALALLL